MYNRQIFISVLLVCTGFSVDQNKSIYIDEFQSVYDSKGVVSFNDNGTNYRKKIALYNANGTTFAVISLADHSIKLSNYKADISDIDLDKSILHKKYHFNPQEFFPDYNLIIFSYKNIIGGKAEVYIDKEKTTTKFIRIDSKLFKVESWKNHLIGSVLEIDNIRNPLREKPSDLTFIKKISVPNDASFRIIKFEGAWVQVECFSFCESTCDKKYRGWIRWTNGKQPLLKLYYTC